MPTYLYIAVFDITPVDYVTNTAISTDLEIIYFCTKYRK